MNSAPSDSDKVFRRAEFWEPEKCSLLDIANVIGRWESANEWAERSEFSIVETRRVENMAQGATKERYQYARRNGYVERVALQQNAPKLPFRNAPLAASFGKRIEDFEAMPVSATAVDVVFDALVESKSSLLASKVCDQRRARWITDSGSIDEGALAAGLYKSRAIVCFSWLFYGKGQIYGVAVAGKIAVDNSGIKEQLPPELAPAFEALTWIAALGAAVYAFRSSAAVAAQTSDYETVSAADAMAAEAAAASDEGTYSTVFEKWAARERASKRANTVKK